MNNEVNSFIVTTPAVRHGRPRIVGTGITVHRIAIWYNLGNSAEEIAYQYPHLDLAQVYAALSYYHANRAEIDAEITADQAEADQIEQELTKTKKSA